MQKFCNFAHLKPTFSILHSNFYKTRISVCNNHFIFFFIIILTSSLVNPTFSLFFSKHYSLSLSLSWWIFFLFLLSLIFLHWSSFLLLPLSSLENSINKSENSINKPKNFTSTQTHVNLKSIWVGCNGSKADAVAAATR